VCRVDQRRTELSRTRILFHINDNAICHYEEPQDFLLYVSVGLRHRAGIRGESCFILSNQHSGIIHGALSFLQFTEQHQPGDKG